MADPTPPESRSGSALGIFAHPDDAEIAAGGTMANWVAAGRDVHLLVLTNGDRGSQDPALDRTELARIRARETDEAGAVLGLASICILDVHDGDLENTVELRERVVRRIREVRASTVFSLDPTAVFFQNSYYNHSDHRTAGWVALDSAFPGSGNPHFFPEHLGEGLGVQEVDDVWLGWTNEPNHTEDVTATWQTKIDALAKHASQLTEGIRFFETFLLEEAGEAGKKIGVERAEEFRRLDLAD
ncbi:MAG: PIG-L family deacetylase [Actinomycetota bacterium]|nr:PIG-L family deacetylase [Actinomycetota bacterium]MDH5223681.1 PIG-L family deacetylase [Actinomycetota bacterium]MDH5312285.1 PIG-L family deacetylase [Actinomycetota bacterium]